VVINKGKSKYFKIDSSNKNFKQLQRENTPNGLDISFLFKQSITNIYLDSAINDGLTNINKQICYTIHCYNTLGANREFICYIDTSTNFPVKMITILNMDLEEYSFMTEMNYSNVKFDSINPSIYKEESYTKGFTKIDNAAIQLNSPKLDAASSTLLLKPYPVVTGTNVITNEKVGADYFKNKIILLDFWFINCYPCAKVNEILKKLHQKYKDRGVEIISVNSIDKKEAILKHLKKYKTTHTNLLTKDAVDKAYQVESYPTVFCIDKTGIIKYILHGAAEDAEAQLEAFILTELAKKK
jgi:thiol-disulfide isomerase/thioredoxin